MTRHESMHRIVRAGCVGAALALLQAVPDTACASVQERIGTIVENNLFHPERREWTVEKRKKRVIKKPKKKDRSFLNKLLLYGTIESGGQYYALLRASRRPRRRGPSNSLYMVGDYIQGYVVREITPDKVVLGDPSTEETFVIHIDDERKKRTAVKTRIAPERRSARSAARSSTAEKRAGKKIIPRRALTVTRLKKRLQRSLRILKRRDSRLVRKQALRDYNRLKKLMPHMSDEDRREVAALKRRLDNTL